MLSFKNFFKKTDKYLDMNNMKYDGEDDFDKLIPLRKKFHKLTNTHVKDEHVPHISKYLANSKPIDDHYRGEKSDPETVEGAKHMENLIKKVKTPHNMYMYRGMQSEHPIAAGSEITHHGITSYGSSPRFAKVHDMKHIIRLKVPKDTHAAYIEHISQERKFKNAGKSMESNFIHGGEENWILHPKTKIKIVSTKVRDGVHHHEAELVHDGAKE